MATSDFSRVGDNSSGFQIPAEDSLLISSMVAVSQPCDLVTHPQFHAVSTI